MAESSSSVRLRGRRASAQRDLHNIPDDDDDHSPHDTVSVARSLYFSKLGRTQSIFQDSRTQLELLSETPEASLAVVGFLTILAFALRFYKLNHPDQVVFVWLLYSLRVSHLSHYDLDLTKFILENLRLTISHGNTISTSIRPLQSFSLASQVGSLDSMATSPSTVSATITRTITFHTSACVLCLQSSAVLLFQSSMGS